MSLVIVSGTKENLTSTIDNPVNPQKARSLLGDKFVDEILIHSGIEGLRCWGLTTTQSSIFEDLSNGDEVLISENSTGNFTRYGIVIGKIDSLKFGKQIWHIEGDNPWRYIYFLANITTVEISKSDFVTKLGYRIRDYVQGSRIVTDNAYLKGTSVSKRYNIPVYESVSEVNSEVDFSSKNIQSRGSYRKLHSRFSKSVKSNYGYKCAICGIDEVEFLIAGHISSWAEDEKNRLNPQNGICFCSLHDKAFEHGYIGISDSFEIILNAKINKDAVLYKQLGPYIGKSISVPENHSPDITLLEFHRKKHGLG